MRKGANTGEIHRMHKEWGVFDLPRSSFTSQQPSVETDIHRQTTNTVRDRVPFLKIGSESVNLTLRDADDHQARPQAAGKFLAT
jgi:hypothetical protein